MRKQVFEVQCSRCTRKDLRDGDASRTGNILEVKLAADGPKHPELKVAFEDLCEPCLRSVRALLESVGKKIEGLSPDRKASTDKPEAKKEEPPHTEAAPPAHAKEGTPAGARTPKDGTPPGAHVAKAPAAASR